MKKIIVAVIAGMAFLTACNKDDEKIATCDAYIVSQISGQDTLFGLSLHAYAYSSFSSVTVVPENASEIAYHLQSSEGYDYNYYYDTPDEDLSEEVPVSGNYHFSVVYGNKDTYETDDYVSGDILYPATITQCAYDKSSSQAVIEWNAVEDADKYVVKLYKGDNLVFLNSDEDETSSRKIEISATDSGWDDYKPGSGDSFVVKIYAFMYEPNGDNNNIQAASFAESSLSWGN